MPENKPSLDEWRALYEAAIRFKELAPWQWMEELDISGILNPESGEVGFASIMGMAMVGVKIVQATSLGRLEQAKAAFHRFIR